MFECVINVAEGRDLDALDDLARRAGSSFRDLHSDPMHHRSVFTLVANAPELARDVRALISAAYEHFDLRRHEGVHPRFGVVDVVPFVAYHDDEATALALRDETADWLVETYGVPVFFYVGQPTLGQRTLPEVRRGAFRDFSPDRGPNEPTPAKGAVALGVRDVLVAWNVWLRGVPLAETKRVAAALRTTKVRTLGLDLGRATQVSCNLTAPYDVGPGEVYDAVVAHVGSAHVERAELVGLLPEAVLRHEAPERWAQLGLSLERTIEARVS
ncbi:MAG: hypothetical protein B7X07_07120 [Actinobacteria bacterium 21-64-8]|nr:MAG: hypothetical protein B7X07_07120 [Actinobacteria bacterium 21-64-8]